MVPWLPAVLVNGPWGKGDSNIKLNACSEHMKMGEKCISWGYTEPTFFKSLEQKDLRLEKVESLAFSCCLCWR